MPKLGSTDIPGSIPRYQMRPVACLKTWDAWGFPYSVQSHGDIMQGSSLFSAGVRDVSLHSAICCLCPRFHRFLRPKVSIQISMAPVYLKVRNVIILFCL